MIDRHVEDVSTEAFAASVPTGDEVKVILVFEKFLPLKLLKREFVQVLKALLSKHHPLREIRFMIKKIPGRNLDLPHVPLDLIRRSPEDKPAGDPFHPVSGKTRLDKFQRREGLHVEELDHKFMLEGVVLF